MRAPGIVREKLIAAAFRSGLLFAVFLLVVFGVGPVRGAEPPVIAAASDLGYALQEAAQLFTRNSGRQIKLTFGSSGNFARQIMQGAPFEVFLSADEDYVRTLDGRGLTEGGGTLYAVGRVALFVPAGSPIMADADLKDIRAAMGDGRLKRLAIANPDHAPYGRAAREVLMWAGIWDGMKGRLALGENASQAAQFAITGAAEAGIIPYSLALAMAGRGSFVLLKEEWHAPLRQRMVLIRDAGDTARRFYAFMQQQPARAILEGYGFVLPASGK